MLRWFFSFFFGTPTATGELTWSRGDRVRKFDDEITGTISGLVRKDTEEWVRVVYCGHRTTWVELVDPGLLRAA